MATVLQVNDVNLGNASLDAAVQALKGAAFGPVRLGISRPLQQDAAATTAAGVDNVSGGAAAVIQCLKVVNTLNCKIEVA